MDAYEAYHNSKDNALLLSQTRSEELAKDQTSSPADEGPAKNPKSSQVETAGAKAAESEGQKKEGEKDVKSPTTVTTNNYTTVMQDGANINITNINNHHTYVIYHQTQK